ncbi:MAG: DsbA family oxidoreductase [Planctomycetota bacterium]
MNTPIEIEVFSDFVCPWCPVGERRLDQALVLLGEPAKVTFRPFELNPDLPKEGVDRRAYLQEKFGGPEAYEQLSAVVKNAGACEGFEFAFDRIERTSNTRDAHRLSVLAAKRGLQRPLVAGLFRAYFQLGQDVGGHKVLREVAIRAGLDAQAVDALLASDQLEDEVVEQERRAHQLGITGVPAFVVNGEPVLSGAQPPQVIAAAIREAIGLPR